MVVVVVVCVCFVLAGWSVSVLRGLLVVVFACLDCFGSTLRYLLMMPK